MREKETSLTELKDFFIKTSENLKGSFKREFQASISLRFFNGSPRKTEAYFGWNRNSVFKGIRELETGIKCIDNFNARGNKKTETKLLKLEEDIRFLTDPKSQSDPKFQSPFSYTRITSKRVYESLLEDKGYTKQELPTQRTINNILNRLGYKLKRIQKIKPKKK